MALSDSPAKSIAILVGIALVGTIFIVSTALLRNRPAAPDASTTKPYSEPESGLVFDAPKDWTVSIRSDDDLEVRGVRISQIQTQRGTCTNFSNNESSTLQRKLEVGNDDAVALWQQEFPGLVTVKELVATSGQFVLLGIDTCSLSLNRRILTLRGQGYRNDVEVRFARTIVVDDTLSQSMLDKEAKAVMNETGSGSSASDAKLFRQLMQSVR
ncbi:hypothetical protein HY524_02100 [Candidatus Berkelbacteria bacterium]|nr:hypothetical protein [Candidatus Berkelbacteria bacterium]